MIPEKHVHNERDHASIFSLTSSEHVLKDTSCLCCRDLPPVTSLIYRTPLQNDNDYFINGKVFQVRVLSNYSHITTHQSYAAFSSKHILVLIPDNNCII
jgi:hypothetical protein